MSTDPRGINLWAELAHIDISFLADFGCSKEGHVQVVSVAEVELIRLVGRSFDVRSSSETWVNVGPASSNSRFGRQREEFDPPSAPRER